MSGISNWLRLHACVLGIGAVLLLTVGGLPDAVRAQTDFSMSQRPVAVAPPVTGSAVTPLRRFTKGACPFRVPAWMSVTCGTISVPEDRRHTDSPAIRLAVAIVRARSAHPLPDPLVYLSGGPGSAALSSTPRLARGWSAFLANRDLIVFDQRGTGFSRPSLACPESDGSDADAPSRAISPDARVRAEAAALLRCHDRLVSHGVTPSAYTSAASAADLDDLRLTLGYKQWNILGISYGTRLALTAMRDKPAGIRAVILDSVYPPPVNLYTAMPSNVERSFNALFNGCAVDKRCARAYPDLESQFYDLIAQLDARPIAVTVRDPRTGAFAKVHFDGARLIGLLFDSLYRTDLIPLLPQMVADAHAGKYALLASLENQRLSRKLGFSAGLYFSVQCNEEIPFATAQELTSAAAAHPRLRPYFAINLDETPEIFAFCRSWGGRTPDPRENEPVRSAIPTLILAGAYDPITPPAWARLTASTLEASYVYEFPGTGHAVVARGACPARIIRDFLNDPATAPDASCIAGLGSPNFR